uniref:Uncharacterized protein n=1 Tax=Acrobeloides nanus TaxID=290746 RepID=A0A914CVR8_9BILA
MINGPTPSVWTRRMTQDAVKETGRIAVISDETWKRKMVDDAIERKRLHGPGLPGQLSNEDLDDGITDVADDPSEELFQSVATRFESDQE